MSSLSKRILTVQDLEIFDGSAVKSELLAFVEALNEACRGRTLREHSQESPVIVKLINGTLTEIEKLVKSTPAIATASRFGNAAFRSFFDKVRERSVPLVNEILTCDAQSQDRANGEAKLAEDGQDSHGRILAGYLVHSFGDKSRLDYGSGHELTFLSFLLILSKIGLLELPRDGAAIVLGVFWKYVQVTRLVQQTYWLEPAGSHGVWGLDDYHFLPFLFGSSQLADHPILKPKSIHDDQILEDFGDDYIYFACVKFINSIKTASLRWHSPMLDDISGVKQWSKVNSGLLKMYKAEVLAKLPIMQHFIFSSLLDFQGESPTESWRSVWTEETPGHAHPHDPTGEPSSHNQDCCGIPIPSAFAEAQAKKKSQNATLAKGVAHGQLAGIVPVKTSGDSVAIADAMVEDKSRSIEDVLVAMEEMPLFMQGLGDSMQDNKGLAALQSLAYDGEPVEVAENFKAQGGDQFAQKRYRDALEFYTKAIDVLAAEKLAPENLRTSLHLNRAACHLKLGNYRKVLEDTAEVLGPDPQSVKAFYRAASALLALERFKEAYDACVRGLNVQENQDLLQLKKKIVQAGAAHQLREEEHAERTRRKVLTLKAIEQGLKERNIVVQGAKGDTWPIFDPTYPSIEHAPPLTPHTIARTWEEPKPDMSMLFQVYFLYPEFEITEVVAQFHEQDTFLNQLARMFPDPSLPKEIQDAVQESLQDERVGEGYGQGLAPGMSPLIWRAGNLQLYATLSSGRTTRLGTKLQLGRVFQVLSGEKDRLVLKEGSFHFYVLPKTGSAYTKKWIAKQKASSAAK